MKFKMPLLAITALALAVAVSFLVETKMEKRNKPPITVAIQGKLSTAAIVPENISTIPLFHLNYNLWDTLITEDRGAAIAENFKVSEDGRLYTFQISPNAKFSNGRRIEAQDLKLSLDRLIAREDNGHINAKSTIKNVLAQDGRLVIELGAPTPSFLYLLSTPEFGIVPKEALDNAGNIISHRVTSGAYTIENIDLENQRAILTGNPYFRGFPSKAPRTVVLEFTKGATASDIQDKIRKKQYDFIEFYGPEADSLLPAISLEGYSYTTSDPSFSVFMVSNSSRVSSSDEKAIAAGFRKNFRYGADAGIERPSKQLLPPRTFGALSAVEIATLETGSAAPISKKKITVRIPFKDGALASAVRGSFEKMGISVDFLEYAEAVEYDYFLIGQGMNSEFPEIELYLQMLSPYSITHGSDATKGQLARAVHTTEDGKRSDAIKAICTSLLKEGKVVPIALRSYLHIFNPKRISSDGLSGYDGNIPLYKIQVQ